MIIDIGVKLTVGVTGVVDEVGHGFLLSSIHKEYGLPYLHLHNVEVVQVYQVLTLHSFSIVKDQGILEDLDSGFNLF